MALCCLLLIPVHSVYSAIHQCRLADGTITFQDTACPIIPKAKAEPTEKKKTIPFGIEKTWFDTPSVVPDRAICTKTDCHCGMFTREFKSGLSIAIADALYLDGSWHRLDSTLQQLESNTLNAIERADLRQERDEAACNVLMSQQMLRLFGSEVLRDLRTKKRYAEDRGWDDVERCDAGDDMVCEYTDLITLYQRIQADIKALRNRGRLASEDELLATGEEK